MINLNYLKDISKMKQFGSGAVIIEEGYVSDGMYILLKGNVNVFKNYDKPNRMQITTLGPGSFFGEMSLFMSAPRTATVVAADEVCVLELTHDNIHQFFRQEPDATFSLITSLCERLDKLNNMVSGAKTAGDGAGIGTGTPQAADERRTGVEVPPKAAASAAVGASSATVGASPTSATPVKKLPLFPDGHSEYDLSPMLATTTYLVTSKYSCPICGKDFEDKAVRASNLKIISTDYDLRKSYDTFDPLRYLTITCPYCWFSTIRTDFNKASAARDEQILEKMRALRANSRIDFGGGLDAEKVFASMYISLECIPLATYNPDLTLGRVWLNISWLYRDCKDPDMERYAIAKALERYMSVLDTGKADESAKQQIYLVAGELSYKLGDLKSARNLLYEAYKMRDGQPIFRGKAAERLEDVKRAIAEGE